MSPDFLPIIRPAAMTAAVFAIMASGEARHIIEDPECMIQAQPGGGLDLTCRVLEEGFIEVTRGPIQASFVPGGSGVVAINVLKTTRTALCSPSRPARPRTW